MQIEAVCPRMTALRFGRLDRLGRVPKPTKARARMRPERHGSLHRRRRQPGQHRRLIRPCVRRGAVAVALSESPAIEQACDARLHSGQHLLDVQSRQRACGVKGQGAGTVPREDAIQHECVGMEVEIEGSPKPLNHGYRAPTTVGDAAVARASAQNPEHGADEDGDDPAAHVVIPRQLIPQAVRQTQNPLPYRDIGEHVIDEVGGALRHPAAAAAWTQPALTRKRDQPVEAAVVAAKPREATRQPSTVKEVPELLLNESRQPFTVA